MLDGMRRMSQSLVGRIIMAVVMGVISLSFAIWGIGNIFVGYNAGEVAKVGKTVISSDDVRQLYQRQLQNLQQRARRPITNEQARQMGLDRQVLAQLVGDATLDERARALGLAMSDQEIVKKALVDPAFAGPNGQFDQARFNSILRDNGYSEQSFVREQRRLYLRQEYAGAITGDMPAPIAALEVIHEFRDETRSIEYVDLPASSAGDIPPPDQSTLEAYFKARQQSFRAPEYRKLATLTITPSRLVDPSSVSDADAQKLYDEVKGQRFGSPAKRDVQQVVFADEGAAKQASDKIKAGASLGDVAAQAHLKVAELGDVTKAEIFDPAIADAAFGLAANATSEPVKGQFGYAIVHVVAATPESVKPFADVEADLKKEIALSRAKQKVDALRDKIEDERTSGKALAEAAAAVGEKARTIDAIDQSGRDKSGAEVPDLTERDALLRAAFASNIGVDNDTLNTPDGGSIWFEVAGIDPARDRTLDEVKDKVVAAWRDDEIARRLSDKAQDLVKKVDGGESIDDVGKELSLAVKQVSDVRRLGTTSVPQSVVLAVFNRASGKAGSAAVGDGRTVFKVLDSVTPPLDAESDVMKAVRDQLKQSYAEDLLGEYLVKAQDDAGVTVNDAAFRAAIGGSGAGDQ